MGRLIFDSKDHKIYMFPEHSPRDAIQSNQYLIIHRGKAVLLDPGGNRTYHRLFEDISSIINPKEDLEYIILSHQDPDIVASLNGWLMTTKAYAVISKLWTRFIPHFGLNSWLEGRIVSVGDEGCVINLSDLNLFVLPAHFLHSPGNFQVYDPLSKTLFSGDLGASVGMDYLETDDIESHIKYMEGFHKRYMASNKVCRLWAKMARELDIERIAPQHGAIIEGKEAVKGFIEWIKNLRCGVDLLAENDFRLPKIQLRNIFALNG